MKLTAEDKKRYSRQTLIPEFGENGQIKLKTSKVLVIGAGGLGSPVLLYLAAAGVGTIGIVENDTIALSNLQRQILYTTAHIGKSKIEEAEKKISEINPSILVEKYAVRLSSKNALEIIEKYDVIIDCSDNFPTRYLVNDACSILNKPFVYGAIYRFEGQVAVFNYNNSATYRDLFPEPPTADMAPNCAAAGVLGVMAGIIGTFQANETIKIITQIGTPLSGKILLIDTLSMAIRTLKIPRISTKKVTHLIENYETFCGVPLPVKNTLTFQDLSNWKSQQIEFQLIDVREEVEYKQLNIGGMLIPLSEIEARFSEIRKDIPVIIHCQSGVRAKKALYLLETSYGYSNLYFLSNAFF
jgi:sulfur-carrier protein adenylyltransferase/sulfurtransferase